ncbi:MAG: hypothetical protein CMG11_05385 [Candidatus Marinimicrobia bacterium]|nr:hypothetical protein [Candidatus Neomarinimicrobiota bacterium]
MNYRFYILLIAITSMALSDLIKPSLSESLRATHVLFEWEQEPDANGYTLQVSDTESFSDLIINIDLPTTSYIAKENLTWEQNYFWRVRALYNSGQGQWMLGSFDIQNRLLIDVNVESYDEDATQDGIMIYSQFGPYFAVGGIDKWGNEVWNTQTAYMNHINEHGQMYGVFGQQGARMNFNHEILWSTPEGTDIDSHEVKQIPNGNYMAFVPIFQNGPISPYGNWAQYFQAIGYAVDGVTNEFPWMGLRIVEFDQNTGEEVWSWNPFEHFTMQDNDIYEGTWWNAAFNGSFDWMHSNAFHFDEEESVIYVSHRHLSRISKIAYPSGEVIWNMGLPSLYNTGNDNICTDLLFSFQHHIQLMDDGTLLFFDNGNLNEVLTNELEAITRIRRVEVVDNSYCETVWQFDLPGDLHGLGMGSVQLLDNGNYFIYTFGKDNDNSGEGCTLLEISPDGNLVWKATSQDFGTAWYRSYKIPSIYPQAFDLMAIDYTSNENGLPIIQATNNDISFMLYNKGGYSQTYMYNLFDAGASDFPMFENQSGQITLEPEQSHELSFAVNNSQTDETNVEFSIWPVYHDYEKKDFSFYVVADNSVIGDINSDLEINILDVVLAINIVLSGEYNSNVDLNNDSSNNILDIVQLINLIIDD